MNKLFLILLLPLNILAQDFISSDSFDSKIAKGTCVVEFWAEWNKSNEVVFLNKLKDCNSYKVCVASNSDVQKKYKVISVPTLIEFDNGIEVSRFEPNIMMKLIAEKKEVQATVDEITLNKFQ